MKSISTQTGRFDLTAYWLYAGHDILVLIVGGQAHLGAVAIAESHFALNNTKLFSATVSVFCYPKHKEDNLVQTLAFNLATTLGVKVIVAAGIHWDNLTFVDIEEIKVNYNKLGELLLASIIQEINLPE